MVVILYNFGDIWLDGITAILFIRCTKVSISRGFSNFSILNKVLRVESDKFFFEIPTLLSWEQGKSEENVVGKIQNIYVILNFPALDHSRTAQPAPW